MEMHQVRYFLAVCRTLNFTKAAEECNVAQPSLTRAIQKLEDELGGLLFHRERANTHLTELGRAMQPHLERTFEAAQAAKQLATGFKRGEVAHLRLGVSASVPSEPIARVLGGVNKAVPTLELTLGSGPDSALVEGAVAGDLDVVVTGDDGDLSDRLRSWTLYREPIMVVMSPGHALAGKAGITLSDLNGIDVIELDGDGSARRLRELCAETSVASKHRARAANREQLLSLVREGLGVALLPASAAGEPGLVARALEGVKLERAVVLGTVAGRRFSPASDAFVKLARMRDWQAGAPT